MNKLSGRYGSADLPNSVVLTQSLANSWVRFCYYFIRRSAFPSEISNNGLRFWVKSQISPLETSKPTLLPRPSVLCTLLAAASPQGSRGGTIATIIFWHHEGNKAGGATALLLGKIESGPEQRKHSIYGYILWRVGSFVCPGAIFPLVPMERT